VIQELFIKHVKAQDFEAVSIWGDYGYIVAGPEALRLAVHYGDHAIVKVRRADVCKVPRSTTTLGGPFQGCPA
jgi:hypothetical protein